MRGRIDGAKTSHRIDAARLLLKLGSDDAPALIADFSSHSRPGGGSAYSSVVAEDKERKEKSMVVVFSVQILTERPTAKRFLVPS